MSNDTGAPAATITEFIEARITEDEAVAREADSNRYSVEGGGLRWGEVGYNTLDDLTIDPARVLAQCEAMRQIVKLHAPEEVREPWRDASTGEYHPGIMLVCRTCGPTEDIAFRIETYGLGYPCSTTRALAAIWSDHPDYDEQWRP